MEKGKLLAGRIPVENSSYIVDYSISNTTTKREYYKGRFLANERDYLFWRWTALNSMLCHNIKPKTKMLTVKFTVSRAASSM